MIGFGIDGPGESESSQPLGADGVVVGTAIVRAIETGASADERQRQSACDRERASHGPFFDRRVALGSLSE